MSAIPPASSLEGSPVPAGNDARRDGVAPATIFSAIICLSVSLAFVVGLWEWKEYHYADRYGPGLDFKDFYAAAQDLRSGVPIYARPRCVTPPLAAALFLPLSYLPSETALHLFLLLSALAVPAAVVVTAIGYLHMPRSQWPTLAIVLAGVMVGYPYMFLLERGNLDGIILFILAGVLVSWRKHQGVAGFLLAVATASKLYPAVLIIPLIVERRWRALAVLLASCAIFYVCLSGDWNAYFTERLFARSTFFLVGENVSLSAALHHLRNVFLSRPGDASTEGIGQIATAAAFLFFAFLGLLTYGHHRSASRSEGLQQLSRLSFLLLMTSVPAHVYPYTELVTIPLVVGLCLRWGGGEEPSQRALLALSVACLGLAQMQSWALRELWSLSWDAVPALANLVALASLAALLWKSSAQPEAAAVVETI